MMNGTAARYAHLPSCPLLLLVLALATAFALALLPSACSSGSDDGEAAETQTTRYQEPEDGTASEDEATPEDGAAPDAVSDTPDSLTLTADDDGGTFAIRSGGTVLLELEANPSTGFAWEMDDPDPEASLLEQVIDPSFKSDDPEAMGAGGIMTYTFRAVDEGEMVLRMAYIPPSGGEATKTFEITLVVEG